MSTERIFILQLNLNWSLNSCFLGWAQEVFGVFEKIEDFVVVDLERLEGYVEVIDDLAVFVGFANGVELFDEGMQDAVVEAVEFFFVRCAEAETDDWGAGGEDFFGFWEACLKHTLR